MASVKVTSVLEVAAEDDGPGAPAARWNPVHPVCARAFRVRVLESATDFPAFWPFGAAP